MPPPRGSGEQTGRVGVAEPRLVDLVIDGEVITTTEDHPFWSVTDQRFERTDQLGPNERVLSADGQIISVSGLEQGSTREALAYNLAVEGIHTYHVGDAGILVHNRCSPLTGAQSRQALNHIGVDTRRVVGRTKGGEPVYQLPDGRVITRDLDGHNGSGAWKVARRVKDLHLRQTREGTFGLDSEGNLMQVGP